MAVLDSRCRKNKLASNARAPTLLPLLCSERERSAGQSILNVTFAAESASAAAAIKSKETDRIKSQIGKMVKTWRYVRSGTTVCSTLLSTDCVSERVTKEERTWRRKASISRANEIKLKKPTTRKEGIMLAKVPSVDHSRYCCHCCYCSRQRCRFPNWRIDFRGTKNRGGHVSWERRRTFNNTANSDKNEAFRHHLLPAAKISKRGWAVGDRTEQAEAVSRVVTYREVVDCPGNLRGKRQIEYKKRNSQKSQLRGASRTWEDNEI